MAKSKNRRPDVGDLRPDVRCPVFALRASPGRPEKDSVLPASDFAAGLGGAL